MATFRDRPYAQFSFLVDLGDGAAAGPKAGFQEVSGIEVAVPRDRATKITGLNKSTQVTLKRGVIGSPALREWLDQIRDGNANAMRTVTISLQNEARTAVVGSWKLLRARIVKHTSAPLNAKGNDVAMEELVLACEGLEAQ
ncbi:MAG TPA: phage tail protein [Burkholderiaceae bacterium]